MIALLWRRLLQIVPITLGISALTFLLVRLIPGDPALAILGFRGTAETIARVRADLGLDRSLAEQYALFLRRLFAGDLGHSYVAGQPVGALVAEQLPATILLVAYSLALSALIAVPLALTAAVRRGSIADHAIRAVNVLGFSLPNYWLGMLLLLLFTMTLPLFPVGGYGQGFFDHLYHLFLPALTLAAGVVPVVLNSIRASMIEALRSAHVRAARAKGLSERAVILAHVLYNSLNPAVTLLGVHASVLVGGTLVVESLFGVPGLGMLLFRAIRARDYPTVQGATMTIAVLTALIQLFTDMAQMLLDPRVRRGAR